MASGGQGEGEGEGEGGGKGRGRRCKKGCKSSVDERRKHLHRSRKGNSMEVSGRSGVTGLASSLGVRRMASLRSPAGQQQKHGGRPKWTTIVMATTGPSSSMSSLSSNVVPLSRYRKSYGRAYIQCWYLYKSGGPLDGVGHEGRHKAKKNVHRERLMVHAMSSSFGRCFRVTTFGESHGSGVGCVVDGCPPALSISRVDIQQELDR